jgi:hypothetical protein
VDRLVGAGHYYRWREEYGGMKVDQAKRFKELEVENARLKKLVADQAFDNAILREAAKGNFQAQPDAGMPSSMRVVRWTSVNARPAG